MEKWKVKTYDLAQAKPLYFGYEMQPFCSIYVTKCQSHAGGGFYTKAEYLSVPSLTQHNEFQILMAIC